MFNFAKKIRLTDTDFFQDFVDFHSHILPNVDDGMKSEDEALETLSYFEKLGVRKIIFTPHIEALKGSDVENFHTEVFNSFVVNYRGGIELALAAEYMLDNSFMKRMEKLMYLEEKNVLLETSCVSPFHQMDEVLYELSSNGITPILAHPERYLYMGENHYRKMKDRGYLFQLNITSLLGGYGKEVEKKAVKLLNSNFYDRMGTDIHSLPRFREIINSNKLTIKQIDKLNIIKHEN